MLEGPEQGNDLLFSQFIGCHVKNGMWKGKSGSRETSGELLHTLHSDKELRGTKSRKRVSIIPLWCSVWSKPCACTLGYTD